MKFRGLQRPLVLLSSFGHAEFSPLRPATYRLSTSYARWGRSFRSAPPAQQSHARPARRGGGLRVTAPEAWRPHTLRTPVQTFVTRTPLRRARPTETDDGSPPASPAASSAAPEAEADVAAELVEELRRLLRRFPPSTWLPVSDLYEALAPATRRAHVRPHRSLARALRRAAPALGVHLDATGAYCAYGAAPAGRAAGTKSEGTGPAPREDGAKPEAQRECAGKENENEKEKEKKKGGLPPTPCGVNAPVSPAVAALVDFYYDVGLKAIPPPPADLDVTPSSLHAVQGTADGTVLALRDFVPFIPPFFVPLDEVLENMTGYTEQHILDYFNSKAMEVVHIAGRRYIRLYGGYGSISLDGCEAAEEAFEMYRPRLDFLPAFVKAFEGVYEQWMSLEMLLRKTDPEVVSQMNPKGPAAIIYFAQMQHVFGFSVLGGRDGNTADESSSSVLLRKQPYTGLTWETTPTPKSVSFILQRVPVEGSMDVHAIQSQITPSLQQEIDAYYNDIIGFFKAHAPIFFLTEDHTVVMRTRYWSRMQVATLPLEEQLKIAMTNRDKRKVRAIRRRIAFRDNPSHPFHDPDNLAREMAKYVPQRGFVSLKVFLRTNIPEDLLSFMPAKMNNFFINYPQYFQHFEYQTPGMWCVSRPGQPLPRGVIRQRFSEDDLVRLIAEYLQRSSGPKACSSIFINIPRGAQEIVRKRHGGLYYLVEKYPQYFNIVLPADSGNLVSGALVHLVSLPQSLTTKRGEGTAGESGDLLGDDDGGNACRGGQGEDSEEEHDYDH